MSKSNVNPNHYKVAGRERQGEDIAQTRNKQKLAESLVRSRSEPDARPQKPGTRQAVPLTRAVTPKPRSRPSHPRRNSR